MSLQNDLYLLCISFEHFRFIPMYFVFCCYYYKQNFFYPLYFIIASLWPRYTVTCCSVTQLCPTLRYIVMSPVNKGFILFFSSVYISVISNCFTISRTMLNSGVKSVFDRDADCFIVLSSLCMYKDKRYTRY